MRVIKRSVAVWLLIGSLLLLNLAGCSTAARAADLMEGIEARSVNGREMDGSFIKTQADFAVKLFQNSLREGENSLISPLSVMLALSMTANGAAAETRREMEALLGGGVPLEELNRYLYSYVNGLPNDSEYKLQIANSIWFRDEENVLQVKKDFLQINADYYRAAAYKADFNDSQTVKDINQWVKKNTDGMIDKIVDQIGRDTMMYLINALVFDAQWQKTYEKDQIHDGSFTTANGTVADVQMMYSIEDLYLNDGNAVGFIKNYRDGKYSFAALLPNEGVSVGDYIQSLTGEKLLQTVRNAESVLLSAVMPKFSYDYEIGMNNALAALGMRTAFDGGRADFSNLGQSSLGNIYIGEVLHKTFICVDELGTKAGAVTKVEMKAEGAVVMPEKQVVLDRPFVYLILDNATGLPIFMGTVMDLQK
ncbi:MAG: serpin family protein [Clostridiales bacterium]|nr:serpin family protein [Clostridiales bacterium]